MYSEISFIFDKSLNNFNNKAILSDGTLGEPNTGNIYGKKMRIRPAQQNTQTSQGQQTTTSQGSSTQNPSGDPNQSLQDAILVYKGKDENDTIQNYYKGSVFYKDDTNEDPYISLMQWSGDASRRSLRLRAADFAYLKDLGVYPINRLWILRRFPDNCVVPNNLLEWGNNAIEPVSTIVGWIKDREDAEFLSVSFHEVWIDQNNMIDKVIGEILKNEFGLAGDKVMSVPGWGQGVLFGMLQAMGFTDDFNAFNVVTGDPNVLRVGKMRDINNQGLVSKMNVELNTCYEQKYINGIDPGMAMMDIISNLAKLGTSDQKFILSSTNEVIKQFINNVNNTVGLGAWIDLMQKLIDGFIGGVQKFIDQMKSNPPAEQEQPAPSNNTDNDSKSKDESNPITAAAVESKLGVMKNVLSNLTNSLLAGTVYKYRWPMKGTIGLMTGISTTPWHLTVGNPYSPIINIGNIVVNDVNIKLSNDLGFNDMPARIDVNVQIDFGRPLGKQEIEKMFNNGYKRLYSKSKNDSMSESVTPTSQVTANETPSTVNVNNNQGQPVGTKTLINKSVYNPFAPQ